MRRALRRVWSPGWVLFVCAGTYVLFDVFFAMLLFTETRGGFAQLDRDVLGIAISNVTVAALVTILAGLYGAYRVWGFHPIFQAEYHRWLRSTPWSAPRKLPMGPVHVVWQDLLLLTILTLLMLRHISLVVGTKAGVEWAVPTALILMLPGLAFLVSRLILLAITFRFTRVPDFAFAIGFGFGFLLLARGMLIPTLLVAIGLYVIEFMGLRRALHQFCDWDLRLLPSQGINRQTALREAQKNQPSWPFSVIGPKRNSANSISYRDAILTSLLFGWFVYVLGSLSDASATDLRTFSGWVCVPIAAARLLVYMVGYLPPIRLDGRLATGRLIIPGYDKIMIAPICTFLPWILIPPVLGMLSISAIVVYSLTCAATLGIGLSMGPTLESWRLTGGHRIVSLGERNR